MIPDPIAELTDMLLDDTDVAALVGTHVHGGELPPSLNRTTAPTAVVLSPAGGPGRMKSLKIRWTRVDTICYAPTLADAWAIHIAVREALETMARTETLLSVETSSDGALARDATTQWPTCYASYGVLSAIDP